MDVPAMTKPLATKPANLLALFGLTKAPSKVVPQTVDKLVQRIAEEDTQSLAEAALRNLKSYVAQQGAKCLELPDGWKATVKVRLTTRSSGRTGRTTTNSYTSPSGKICRSHAAVVEFLRASRSTPASSPGSCGPTPDGLLSPPLTDVSDASDGDGEPCAKRCRH
ncbi:hypothetical protein CHLRE_06g272600v5 [Chlamydomonas reinhardtii]|uniref:MBD domain-containing protein n=1 Tax=Chlamydomonas reinhardtii TaxID=3055 RepID=A0A2K3DNH2_CHLRE|nr:uncharacterized protein CHLRE_06g272600v5 [Chlamydomonas reinhardtii]PNW82072.1 hypothetical protein CHLRE_06g272600v5 [Chlamydomonas reinhardtii]